MIKKNITYTDFDGEERTDAFYFNLTEAELLDIELDYGGNMSKAVEGMLERHDAKGLFGIIENLIRHSYGEKSPDGKRFMKNKELTDGFVTTGAYSAMVIELLSDEKEFEKFMTAVIPSNIRDKVEQKFSDKDSKPTLEVIEGEGSVKE